MTCSPAELRCDFGLRSGTTTIPGTARTYWFAYQDGELDLVAAAAPLL